MQSCTNNSDKETKKVKKELENIIYTPKSKLKNNYEGFNSVKAVNRIAEIENEYFNNFKQSVSKYYGTAWYEAASGYYFENDSISYYVVI